VEFVLGSTFAHTTHAHTSWSQRECVCSVETVKAQTKDHVFFCSDFLLTK